MRLWTYVEFCFPTQPVGCMVKWNNDHYGNVISMLINTTLNRISSVWLNLVLLPSYLAQHLFLILWQLLLEDMLEDMLEFSFYHCYYFFISLLTLNSNKQLPHISILFLLSQINIWTTRTWSNVCTYYVLRPKLEMDGKDKNLEVIQMPLWKGTMVQLQRLGRKLVRFQRRVRLIRNWRRHHKKSMRTTFNSSWNHRKTKKLERQRNLKSKI